MLEGINGNTQLFGILGNPVGHSLSPRIHNAAFRTRKLNAVYVPLPVEKADATLKKALLRLPFQGLSVTIPHKAWAAKAADKADPLTHLSGAANTLIPAPDGLLYAYNTDGPGALRALKTGVSNLRARRILLIGYGGSATAIAHSLLLDENPALLAVTGRNKRKCGKFTEALKRGHPRSRSEITSIPADLQGLQSEDIDIIIQTTPLGMQGQSQELPIPAEFVQGFHTVFDIVYNPARTPLLACAGRKKAKTVPGYLMLLYQAVLQFELFTKKRAPESLMERELLSALRMNLKRRSHLKKQK